MNNASFILILAACLAQTHAAEKILLRAATVHTVSGETFSPGDVLIEGTKITAVNPRIDPAGARVIDLSGQHLYPGLIAPTTSLGLTEIGAVRATQDTSETGEFTPDVQAWIAVNPDSELLPVARANGIAHALTLPLGGTVSGYSGLIALDGWTIEDLVVRHPIALHLFWPAMLLNTATRDQTQDKSQFKSIPDQSRDRLKRIKEIDDFFAEARAYARLKQNKSNLTVPAWEAMLPVVNGSVPVMIHANEYRQIKSAVQWAATNQIKMILAGGRDAWRAAELLAQHKIPVIFENTFELPARETDSYDVHFKAPALLHQAGVRVLLSEGPGAGPATQARNLPYAAAQAAAFGLPRNEALKGITLYPAELFQVADRLGSIAPGKDATLFSASGDILDIRSEVKHLWIAGREISLQSRHTRLHDKYRLRPK